MIFTKEDVELLAKCAWLEARGSGIGACCAVMHVVVNRIGKPGFAWTLEHVINAPNAFSWTRPDNPEYGLKPPDNDPVYQACLIDAPLILAGTDDDITKGALFYANEAETGEGWYRRNIIEKTDVHPITLIYGKHTFRL